MGSQKEAEDYGEACPLDEAFPSWTPPQRNSRPRALHCSSLRHFHEHLHTQCKGSQSCRGSQRSARVSSSSGNSQAQKGITEEVITQRKEGRNIVHASMYLLHPIYNLFC